jgi:arabinofuranosyltransferase
VYQGWRIFWFLTDDAYIAFRYVANSVAGFGYVWNPPPFSPVEGYTSFLWVVILDVVWRVTGVLPPESANWISLGFGYATLGVVLLLFRRMQLPASMEPARPLLLAVVLFGSVANRTFLAWLSSGLETSLFNFCLTAWIFLGTQPADRRGDGWVLGLSSMAALTALTRPDGLLVVVATVLVLTVHVLREVETAPERWRRLASALPLLAVPAHVGWRLATYGAWLPNTYYAKHVAAWPESGVRYAASFVLEYGVWVWLVLLGTWVLKAGLPARLASRLLDPATITVAAVVGQLGYYTLRVGGDHFEYRVYSYLVPLLFVSAAWLAARIATRPGVAVALCVAFVLASWPIPWTHWWQTRGLVDRADTFQLTTPIAHHFPPGLRAPVSIWDGLQSWLIAHMVCVRHQEHMIFHVDQLTKHPPRGEAALDWAERNVCVAASVGVLGWRLPNVAIIDQWGLNDAAIAHSSRRYQSPERRMAHERRPPARYLRCYKPNVEIREAVVLRAPRELTDDEIRSCERIRW